MTRRVLIWGAIVAVAYLSAAAFTRVPLRPLFDGLAPPAAYNWVNTPQGTTPTGQKPSNVSQKLPLKAAGTDEISVATADGQATLILTAGAFTEHGTDTDVRVDITPSDANTYGAAPSGLSYDGNAYSISATYEPSGATANLALDATVLLSYATNANKVMHRSDAGWQSLTTTDVAASLQVFARTKQLGVFAPAGPATSQSLRWWTLGIASGIAALLGLGFGLRERRRLSRQ